MMPGTRFKQLPANVRALVGMIACHATGVHSVNVTMRGEYVTVEVGKGQQKSTVWNVSLSLPDAIEQLEEADAAIQIAVRRQFKPVTGGAK